MTRECAVASWSSIIVRIRENFPCASTLLPISKIIPGATRRLRPGPGLVRVAVPGPGARQRVEIRVWSHRASSSRPAVLALVRLAALLLPDALIRLGARVLM